MFRAVLVPLVVLATLLAFAALMLLALRMGDARADRMLRAALCRGQGIEPARFDEKLLEGLPEPATRFFRFAIRPGARLWTVAAIEMAGELSLGSRERPDYRPMRARQVLAPPVGFLWQVRLPGPVAVTGSDALTGDRSWSRFRLFDFVPVGRASGPDHLRSAFGRMVGEGLFWTPAAFLPAAGDGWDAIEWHAAGPDTAAVTVRWDEIKTRVEITLDPAGRPLHVVFQRWSNENAAHRYQWQPFGGDLGAFESFDGFRLPTAVDGGNHYGTPLYHPFYRARVRTITFGPGPGCTAR